MEQTKPEWVDPRGTIDEIGFCQEFLWQHPMICVDGAFFTREGRIHDERILRKQVLDMAMPYLSTNVVRKVDALIAALRIVAQSDDITCDPRFIHVANGTFVAGEGFQPGKLYCRHRLPVNFNPDAPEPVTWLAFLDQLLEPEDILTLQEYMGYCLIPTNAAQKMLLITGRGGEGKSRIGVVMKDLLGQNMNIGSIAKVEQSPFARADLEHVLLLVDDDLKMEALKQTNYIKSIITAELPMDLERKGVQSYQGTLCVRFMAFGNGSLQALHDRSYGFFRRQIILSVKERDKAREDDPFLSQRLRKEREGIFLWALEGLYRLWGNNFRFTISHRTQENMHESMSEGVNILEFMESEGYFRFDPLAQCSSRVLYRAYKEWCEDNSLPPLGSKSFISWLKQNAADFPICYNRTVPIGSGKHARGFNGIRVLPRA